VHTIEVENIVCSIRMKYTQNVVPALGDFFYWLINIDACLSKLYIKGYCHLLWHQILTGLYYVVIEKMLKTGRQPPLGPNYECFPDQDQGWLLPLSRKDESSRQVCILSRAAQRIRLMLVKNGRA